MDILIYIILLWVFVTIIVNFKLYRKHLDITIMENKLLALFDERFGLIPGFFEVSKRSINKHLEVFSESLKIFKLDSTVYSLDTSFQKRFFTMSFLNHEFDFLFKVFNRHKNIIENYKFIYLRKLLDKNQEEISKNMLIYDKYIKNYNILIKLNKILLVGLLLPSNIEK